jgi:leader peptidase (prepilin peptidase)/N-methyltransferase
VNAGAGVLLGLVGIPVGSFLNVVVERTPERLPLRGPGPAADGGPPPRTWLGVPVQPWLLRGGDPAERHRRWLAVELLTAAVFAAYGTRYGDSSVVIPLLVLGACLVAISVIDLEHLRIPDRVTFPALALAVPAIVVVSLQHHLPGALRGAAVGSIAYFLLLLVPHLAYPRGMGFGDVKLALLMGLLLGWLGWAPDDEVLGPVRLVLYALMLGCLTGVVFGIGHAAVTRRRGEFPFGPALAVACIVVTIWVPS